MRAKNAMPGPLHSLSFCLVRRRNQAFRFLELGYFSASCQWRRNNKWLSSPESVVCWPTNCLRSWDWNNRPKSWLPFWCHLGPTIQNDTAPKNCVARCWARRSMRMRLLIYENEAKVIHRKKLLKLRFGIYRGLLDQCISFMTLSLNTKKPKLQGRAP